MQATLSWPAWVLLGTGLIGGCSSINTAEKHDAAVSEARTQGEKMQAGRLPPSPMQEMPWLGLQEMNKKAKEKEHAWLKGRTVQLKKRDGTLNARQMLELFQREAGVTMTSSLPIDQFSYAGGGFHKLDVETALKIVFGRMGLDYVIHDDEKYVEITPMVGRQWFINVGRRSSSFSSGGLGAGGTGAVTPASAPSSTTTSPTTTADAPALGASGQTGVSLSVTDQFWPSLQTELEQRMMRPVPRGQGGGAPAAGGGMINFADAYRGGSSPEEILRQFQQNANPAPPGGRGQADFESASQSPLGIEMVPMGDVSVNPDTGAVTVSAPRWLQEEIGDYISQVKKIWNTSFTFRGLIVRVQAEKGRRDGLSVNAFVDWAGQQAGAVVSNAALGGVTVSFPDDGSNIPSAVAQTGAQTLMGINDQINGIQLFSAYLRNLGAVDVRSRPQFSANHAVPVKLDLTDPIYYTDYSTQTAGGTTTTAAAADGSISSGVVALQATTVKEVVGTSLRVLPRYDWETGKVRVQLSFLHRSQTGVQPELKSVQAGAEVRQFTINYPKIAEFEYAGEVLMSDRTLLIVGGQQLDSVTNVSSGLPGHAATGGFFTNIWSSIAGVKEREEVIGTTYFALEVRIHNES